MARAVPGGFHLEIPRYQIQNSSDLRFNWSILCTTSLHYWNVTLDCILAARQRVAVQLVPRVSVSEAVLCGGRY